MPGAFGYKVAPESIVQFAAQCVLQTGSNVSACPGTFPRGFSLAYASVIMLHYRRQIQGGGEITNETTLLRPPASASRQGRLATGWIIRPCAVQMVPSSAAQARLCLRAMSH